MKLDAVKFMLILNNIPQYFTKICIYFCADKTFW